MSIVHSSCRESSPYRNMDISKVSFEVHACMQCIHPLWLFLCKEKDQCFMPQILKSAAVIQDQLDLLLELEVSLIHYS